MLNPVSQARITELADPFLKNRIKRNLLTLVVRRHKFEALVAEFGGERFLAKIPKTKLKILLFENLVDWIVIKKIKSVTPQKKSKKLLPKRQKNTIHPKSEDIFAQAPDNWLSDQRAANFIGVSRGTLDKLLVSYSEQFFILFPNQTQVKYGEITYGKKPQSNVALYNPLLVGMVKWYYDQSIDIIEPGSQSINSLAKELNVDFGTVCDLVVAHLQEDITLGKWAQLKNRKLAFYCTPRLISIIKQDLMPDPRPLIKINGYGWEVAAAIVKIINDPRVTESKVRLFISKYRKKRPEWFVPFERAKGKAKAEYCNPRLVKIVVSHFKKKFRK